MNDEREHLINAMNEEERCSEIEIKVTGEAGNQRDKNRE